MDPTNSFKHIIHGVGATSKKAFFVGDFCVAKVGDSKTTRVGARNEELFIALQVRGDKSISSLIKFFNFEAMPCQEEETKVSLRPGVNKKYQKVLPFDGQK